ncbi:MAG: hypothetical protein IPJ65_05270 [Archangiaceae bacterium]|nr:hypothetical protein [Archangiaceae bacterium]
MSADYWLADADARVLGPISLEVLRDLAASGKLAEVRAVSRDGRSFAPISHFPEVLQALGPRLPDAVLAEQQAAIQRLRQWLGEIKNQPAHEVFRVPETSTPDTFRAAFFALVKRFYPDRLSPEATVDLRRACEDVFLALTQKVLEVERRRVTQGPPPSGKSEVSSLAWRGGTIDIRLKVRAHDVRFFTWHPEANFRFDALYIETNEIAVPGTPVNLHLDFEGTAETMTAWGRVLRGEPGTGGNLPRGLGVKLLDLPDSDRSFIRTWIARAGARS